MQKNVEPKATGRHTKGGRLAFPTFEDKIDNPEHRCRGAQGASLEHPYSTFTKEQMTLRDYLANDRTILANERTFLAYIRTALTFFISGVTFIRFFDSFVLHVIGWVFVPAGAVTFTVGLVSYRRMRKMTWRIKHRPGP